MTKKIIATILSVMFIGAASAQQVKKVGIIGLDTSHSIAFTKVLNDDTGKYPELSAYRVVAAYPYGSQTIESSYKRIPGYIEEVKKLDVRIAGSIDELLSMCDFVLLETNDGNLHLEQAAQVFKAGKPVFIDKPVAASLEDAIAIFELARHYNVKCFSSSSLRYTPETQALAAGEFGKVLGADSFSPATPQLGHPDFSWYGIHGVEALFTAMGPDCQSVTRTSVPGCDVVVGVWDGNRIGTFRGNTVGKSAYGGFAFTEKGPQPIGSKVPYDALVSRIVAFFDTGVPPVTEQETLAIFTFMEASNVSRARGGIPVSTEAVFKANHKKALEKVKKYK